MVCWEMVEENERKKRKAVRDPPVLEIDLRLWFCSYIVLTSCQQYVAPAGVAVTASTFSVYVPTVVDAISSGTHVPRKHSM